MSLTGIKRGIPGRARRATRLAPARAGHAYALLAAALLAASAAPAQITAIAPHGAGLRIDVTNTGPGAHCAIEAWDPRTPHATPTPQAAWTAGIDGATMRTIPPLPDDAAMRVYRFCRDNVAAPERWLALRRPRRTNAWHFLTVPLVAPDGAACGLAGPLGVELARGLQGGRFESESPQLWTLDPAGGFTCHWLGSNSVWYTGITPSDATLAPGVACWIKTPPGSAAVADGLLLGRAAETSTPVRLVAGRWNLVGWPFATPRAESDGLPGRQGWEFARYGARGGRSYRYGDVIYLPESLGGQYLYLDATGRWCRRGSTTRADVRLVCGDTFFYFPQGTSFVWCATQADTPLAPPPPEPNPEPTTHDTDADGLADAWEQTWFGSLAATPHDDPDGDGASNALEHALGTDPTRLNEPDTAGRTRLLLHCALR